MFSAGVAGLNSWNWDNLNAAGATLMSKTVHASL